MVIFHGEVLVDDEGEDLEKLNDEDDNAVLDGNPNMIGNHNSYLSLASRRTRKLIDNVEIKDIVKGSVLSLLPAKSLTRFKLVSKDWNDWITRRPLSAHEQSYRFKDLSGFFVQDDCLRSFVTLNQHCYGVPTPDLGFLPHQPNDVITIVSSCNGLLLCRVSAGDGDSYYMCNPVTEQWKVIPEPEVYLGDKPKMVLAFEPSIHNIEANYHIVCAAPLIGQPVVCFEIYSSVTGSWTSSTATCVELGDLNFAGDGYYVNGYCYWETEARRVLAYDLKNEIYGIMNLPLDSPRHGILARIRGELSYVVGGEDGCVSIYCGAMDMDLRQRIDLSVDPVYRRGRCRVLCCVDDETILIWRRKMIYSYNLRDETTKVMCEIGDYYGNMVESVGYLPYINSLVHVA